MNHHDYTKLAAVTDVDYNKLRRSITNRQLQLIHATLGVISEVEELIEILVSPSNPFYDKVRIIEECGDMLWYHSRALTVLPIIKPEHAMENGNSVSTIMENSSHRVQLVLVESFSSKLANDLKRYIYYGSAKSEYDLAIRFDWLGLLISCILEKYAGTTLSECRVRNIAKLKARYGKKFSKSRALNRNLRAELKALSK